MKNTAFFGLDMKAVLVMACCSILAIITVAYKYKKGTACEAFGVELNAIDYRAGSPVFIKANAQTGKVYEWSFGDLTNEKTYNGSISHTYREPGTYYIGLVIDGKCDASTVVTIAEKKIVLQPVTQLPIICPAVAYVNRIVEFKDSASVTGARHWFLDESGTISVSGNYARWLYSTPGIKTIYLKIDGRDDLQGSRTIQVISPENAGKPSTAKTGVRKIRVLIPVIKAAPEDSAHLPTIPVVPIAVPVTKMADFSSKEVSAALEKLVEGGKAPEDIGVYACGNMGLMVVYNNEIVSLREMCNRLGQVKKLNRIKKPVVLLQKSEQTGCLVSMNVTIAKNPLFDRLLKKR